MSATWASIPGDSLRADFTLTNAWVNAGPQPLGRTLTGALNQVNLIAPATMWGERRNNIDMRIAKILRFGRTRTQVGVDIFNLLNADTVTNYNYGFVPGGSWLTPTTITPARYARIGVQVDFAGLEKRAASMGTLGCTDSISKIDLPFNQLTVHLNGIFTPATSR